MSYWTNRQAQARSALEKNEAATKRRVNAILKSESKRLDRRISEYFTQYGVDNVIDYRELKKSLDPADLKLLMEDMDAFAEKYPQYAHLMPVRESIYKLDRLQGLQASVQMQLLDSAARQEQVIGDHLTKTATQFANVSADAMGFGSSFYFENSQMIHDIVWTPWSNGQNFSDRIWGNAQSLADTLNRDIAQGFARGDSYCRLTNQIQERFGHVSRNNAYRLIYTEGTYVMAEASMKPLEEDFDQYRLSTMQDDRVCEICEGVSQQVFEIEDREPGTNFPPLHPWCRCTFTIAVDDWDAWMDRYVEKHGGDPASSDQQRDELRRILERVDGKKVSGLAKANALFVNKNERLFKNASKITKLPEWEDFTCHATPDYFEIDLVGLGAPEDYIKLTPKEYAQRIRNSTAYKGVKIRIISRQAGAKENGAAHQLADELGVDVLAPTETVNVDEDGRIFLSNNDVLAEMWYTATEAEKHMFHETGVWVVFSPHTRG